MTLTLISFGYLHLADDVVPRADRVEDVRDRLRDPAVARNILDLDGRDARVQDVVLRTPGARELLSNLADYATLPAGPRRIAVGCAGGRHRAASLVELLARQLRERGREVVIDHRHIDRPRVLRADEQRAAERAGGAS
jgi:RNase adaptor protein for sRNA GlmZ degradation